MSEHRLPLRIVIQSRLSSSRLPAKALLPLAGSPTSLLCARRAANTGLDTLLATSSDASDDSLAELMQEQGIRCFRGDLNDVLGRYLAATADLPEHALVVRLTADNMLPDGGFVQMLADQLLEQQVDYLAAGSCRPGLPYGMSGEVFRLAALRQAAAEASHPYEREHVTPWIIKHRPRGRLNCERARHWGDLSHLRCTLDSFSDYRRLQQLFQGLDQQALDIPWWQLVQRLMELPDSPRRGIPRGRAKGQAVSRLQLGTVQMGLDYGIANQQGRPSDSQVSELLQLALAYGITHLDTARDYGDAETRIGSLLPAADAERIIPITKLSSLSRLTPEAGPQQVRDAVDASVLRSARELRRQRLPVLMLHRWSHYLQWQGAAWQRLLELRGEGLIGELGVSVYRPREAIEACAEPAITHLQLPFNLLDRRWLQTSVQAALQSRPDLLVHGRSILLQGLFLLPAEHWPDLPDIDAKAINAGLDLLVEELGRNSRIDLCLAYARAQDWLDSLVLGAEAPGQLLEMIKLFQRPALSAAECERLHQVLPPGPEHLVNPALWPL